MQNEMSLIVVDGDDGAAGVCPHDSARLGDEIRGGGVGVTRVCSECGHRWYLNRKIGTTKCLSCGSKKTSHNPKVPVEPAGGNGYNRSNATSVGTGADESRWAPRTSNPPSILIERFFDSRRDGLSPRTLDTYRGYLRLASVVVGLNVSGQDVQRFLATRQCTNGGKHAYFRMLRAFYNWLYSPI